MKKNHNEGFTLIELLVAMAILAAIVLPTCNSMALGFQLNAKADKMMQARLAVSSAVETLMAQGIDATRAKDIIDHSTYDEIMYDFAWDAENEKFSETDDYPNVIILVDKVNSKDGYYALIVKDNDNLVTVTTYIRTAK